MVQMKVKKVHPAAIVPQYHSAGAACFDLHAVIDDGDFVQVRVGQPPVVDTGLAFEVPEGHVMLVFSRSGHGFNNNVRLANCVGVIDSDYRDTVKVKLTKDSGTSVSVPNGARVAQAMVLPIPQVCFLEVEELSSTARGTGGFGSTGA